MTENASTTEQRVKQVVFDLLVGPSIIGVVVPTLSPNKPENINLDANLVDDLGADSLDQIEVVMAIEEEFEIEIQYDDEESFKTVGDIVKYINSKGEA